LEAGGRRSTSLLCQLHPAFRRHVALQISFADATASHHLCSAHDGRTVRENFGKGDINAPAKLRRTIAAADFAIALRMMPEARLMRRSLRLSSSPAVRSCWLARPATFAPQAQSVTLKEQDR
jgi:hypothetical protein